MYKRRVAESQCVSVIFEHKNLFIFSASFALKSVSWIYILQEKTKYFNLAAQQRVLLLVPKSH